MKGLAITSLGIEDVAAKEIKEIINGEAELKQGHLLFNFNNFKELCLLCYKTQSLERIVFLLNDIKTRKITNLKKLVTPEIINYLDKNVNFKVESESEHINAIIGEQIIKVVKNNKNYRPQVDLENPDIIFYIFIDKSHAYLGIDFSGFNLYKRDYRIFTHHTTLRATIAYSLIRIANFKKNNLLVDPFMGSGIIPIEATLYATNHAVNYFRKEKFLFLKFNFLDINFKKFFNEIDKKIINKKCKVFGFDNQWYYVNISKKNAKIAGINKFLHFSRLDVEWLDTKFDKESVDIIATHPPELTKYNKRDLEPLYKELFYQAEFILNNKGKIGIISNSLDLFKKYATLYNFRLAHEREVWSGKKVLKIGIFKKQKI